MPLVNCQNHSFVICYHDANGHILDDCFQNRNIIHLTDPFLLIQMNNVNNCVKSSKILPSIFILFNQKSDLRLLRACLPGQGDHHVVIFLKTLF